MKHSNVAFFIPHVGCPNRCSFCNQTTISGVKQIPCASDVENTLETALTQMSSEALKNSEIAFFGGSFTAIDRDYMISLLKAASKFVGQNMFSGIRISTRPDAINQEILDILKKYNVTSIELGAQSMNDDVLKENFRGHTSQDVINASKIISENGFSLGLQMMTGLYTDTPNESILTAKKIISLKPSTVRIYPTVVLKGTYLEKLYLEGKYSPLDVEQSVTLCAELMDMFEEHNIKVIRVGLHDQQDIKENYVSGAFHPALGELIMSERIYNKIKSLLIDAPKGDISIAVNPKMLSQTIGQKKSNVLKLKELGYNINVIAYENLKFTDIKLL